MGDCLKVYFMGSGEIGIPSLENLYRSSSLKLIGVGTQEDRPAGRNRNMAPTPVGKWAELNHIKIDKIKSVNAPEYIDYIRNLAPDIIVVISFGQLLKEIILNLPELGCLNVHASLLPEYRGASPIASAILNGEKETGITFMKMDKGLDTGDLFCSFPTKISDNMNAEQLESELARIAADHIEDVLLKLHSGQLPPVPQDTAKASLCTKIHKNDGIIDWNEPADLINRKIRAYYPWPGIRFLLDTPERKTEVRITSAITSIGFSGSPGEVLSVDRNRWIVACGNNALELLKVVPQGKKEMSGADFLRGCKITPGLILSAPISKQIRKDS